MADPQTLTQLLSPYIALLTPATLLGLAWTASRLYAKYEDSQKAQQDKIEELHLYGTNHIPHQLEGIQNEVKGLREDMKTYFIARSAIDQSRKSE